MYNMGILCKNIDNTHKEMSFLVNIDNYRVHLDKARSCDLRRLSSSKLLELKLPLYMDSTFKCKMSSFVNLADSCCRNSLNIKFFCISINKWFEHAFANVAMVFSHLLYEVNYVPVSLHSPDMSRCRRLRNKTDHSLA